MKKGIVKEYVKWVLSVVIGFEYDFYNKFCYFDFWYEKDFKLEW